MNNKSNNVYSCSEIKRAESYVQEIEFTLDKICERYSLLIGGGVGYESRKYSEIGRQLDDIDLFGVFDSAEDFELLLKNEEVFRQIEFYVSNVERILRRDIDLFNEKGISVIRLNGELKGIKCSLNISTYARLQEVFDSQGNEINKVAHTNTYPMFKSHGCDGSTAMVGMLPIDISGLYNDGHRHHLLSDFSFLKINGVYHIGLLTDFIAKGKIVKDFQGSLANIQNKILTFIVNNSPLEGSLLLDIFASSELFSTEFKKEFLNRILLFRESNLVGDDYDQEQVNSSYVTVFPKEKYSSISESKNIAHINALSKGRRFKDYILNQSTACEYKEFYILLVELYKYADIYNRAVKEDSIDYIGDISIGNTLIDDQYNYGYKNDRVEKNVEPVDLIIKSIEKDFGLFGDTKNLYILHSIYLRIDIILSIIKVKKIDLYDFISHVSTEIRGLFIERSKVSLELSNYSDLLYSSVGRKFQMVSTCDHVFSSPPLRLIDTYDKIKDKDICVLLYDINLWNGDKYRREFMLDSVFYMEKKEGFFINPEGIYPYNSHPNIEHLSSQQENLRYVLVKMGKQEEEIDLILKRFGDITNILRGVNGEAMTGSQYYKQYIIGLLELFGLGELSEFISNNMLGFQESQFIQNFLPKAITSTFSTLMCLRTLIEVSDFFEGPMFYYTDHGKITSKSYDSTFFLENIDYICTGLKEGYILPSSRLVVWGLALSQIKHFGNDYGAFEKLSSILSEKGYNNNISKLQETGPKEDGGDFLKFAKGTFSYSLRGDKRKLYKNTTKPSRSINMVSVYIHLGSRILEYWNNYKLTGKVETIDFNDIL